MTTNHGKQFLLIPTLALALLGFLSISGCNKPIYPNCKNDSQCKTGPNGEALNGVCVFGKCEECAMNSDCQEGMQCVSNMCKMPCSDDAKCGSGKHCEEGFCQKNCDDSTPCADGKSCINGRCAMPTPPVASDTSGGDKACSMEDKKVHFDFDKSDLKAGDTDMLKQIADCLKKNESMKLVINGHCDERGSTEYNLALGHRRANAVVKFLTNNGVAADRLKANSYGKEKPIDTAHNEAAWAKNRRAEVVSQ